MKKMNNTIRLTCIVVLVSSLIFSFGCKNEVPVVVEPQVTSFSFLKSKNASLTSNIVGKINQENKVITVSLPEDLYTDATARAALKAEIKTSDGKLVKIADDAFKSSPISLMVCGDSVDSQYTVQIKKAGSAVVNGNLLFTEYYSEGASPYKGANNQYIEITNRTTSDIDLSDVLLTRNVWKDGKRYSDMDQSVYLNGVLPADSILVIYSGRCAYYTSKKDTVDTIWQNDKQYNSIITLSGQDGFVLSYNGKVLDVLGPEGGEGNGWNWGVSKKMQRKTSVLKYSKWLEREWLTTVSGDGNGSTTAGKKTENPSDTDKTISYFALEDAEHVIYGKVDDTNHTVEVKISDDMPTVQKITVSTPGYKIQYNRKDVISGETEVDFSKSFKLKVIATDSTDVEYTVTSQIVHYNHAKAITGNYYFDKSKTKAADVIKDNDVILLLDVKNRYILGTALYKNGLSGVQDVGGSDVIEYQTGMAPLCVTKNTDGTYTFTCNGYYLTSDVFNSKTGALRFDASPSDYSVWELKNGSNGAFTLVCPNATDGSDSMGIEYYSGGWYTYKSATTVNIYVKGNY